MALAMTLEPTAPEAPIVAGPLRTWMVASWPSVAWWAPPADTSTWLRASMLLRKSRM